MEQSANKMVATAERKETGLRRERKVPSHEKACV